MNSERRHLRMVEGAGSSPDPYETRIPAGQYDVVLVGEEKLTLFGRPSWRTRWRIIDGPHTGAEVYCFWSIPPKGRRGGPSGAYRTAVEVALERRAPRDLARRNPTYFFGDCILRGFVRDVGRDRNGIERPADCRYSRLAHLIRRLSGVPPALRAARGHP